MQVYRGMDIGTAKPTIVEQRGVRHHMIDVADPSQEFTVAEFRRQARTVMAQAEVPMVIAGGSGLHFRALVDPMSFAPTNAELRAELEGTDGADLVRELTLADPDSGKYVDLANNRRVIRAVEIYRLTGETPSSRAGSAEAEDLRRYVPEIEFTAIGIDPGEHIDDRIDRRLDEMRSGGLVDEVRSLRGRLGRTARSAVGYAEVLEYLEDRTELDRAFEEIRRGTRKLAKKQRTWFQRDPRIRWVPWMEDPSARIDRALEALG